MKLDKLYITIDVEPDCDIYWNRSDPSTFKSVIYGIPQLLRPIWDKYKINPIYFVSPEVGMNKECCIILKEEIKKGAIIGAHLHSEYIEPNVTVKDPAGKPSKEYPCFKHSTQIEYEKINNLTALIQKKLGVRPLWYRAARYGADLDTIKSLSKLGYKYDSSITPDINWSGQGGPDHSRAPKQAYWISRNNVYTPAQSEKESSGIIEVPITISEKRFGLLGRLLPNKWFFYRWLRPTLMSFIEMKKLVDEMYKKYNDPTLVMMFHSMEIMPNKSPYVRNGLMQRKFLKRLERTIKYVQEKNDKLRKI
jgi:hypothetical protein